VFCRVQGFRLRGAAGMAACRVQGVVCRELDVGCRENAIPTSFWCFWCVGALYQTHIIAPRAPNSYLVLRDELRMSSPSLPKHGSGEDYQLKELCTSGLKV